MIENIEQLEELLSRPSKEVVETMGRLEGDLIVLGVGGKIGPTLARMARRADEESGAGRRIIGVARFSSPGLRERLESWGIEPVAADVLDRKALERLPEAPNLLYLPAQKFGTTGEEPRTWAMNTYLAGMVCERYPASRIVAYSTGNVYPLVPVDSGGATEETPPEPIGDYAMSCLGRERMFTYFSGRQGTRVSLLRLNYAVELRYGVLVDIAQRVQTGMPVDLGMGYFNVVWQGDCNAMTLRSFDHASSPPWVANLTGAETLSVRRCAEEFGRLFGRPAVFTGSEGSDALLSDARAGYAKIGRPVVTSEQMIKWIAEWLKRGGETLGKPTHFQTRDGKF